MPYPAKAVAAIRPARPSRPSVKLTAFDMLTMMKAAMGMYHQPSSKKPLTPGMKRSGTPSRNFSTHAVPNPRTTCSRNLLRMLMPRPRWGPRMPCQSSTAPTAPKATMTTMGTSTDRPRPLSTKPISATAFKRTVSRSTGTMNMTPPMVGVPIFTACWLGSSTRMIFPTLK
jgi:hypothetical protein